MGSENKTQLIVRKIQVVIDEQDKELRSEHFKTIHIWRRKIRIGANMIVSHKFVQNNIKDFIYIKDEVKEKFYVKHILAEGKGMSEQNVTYRLLTDMMKGSVPSDMYACLNQAVASTYMERRIDLDSGNISLPSFKKNIPMPFGVYPWNSLQERSGTSAAGVNYSTYTFKLFKIPMMFFFGKDRSGNKKIIEKCIDGEYSFCTSSLVIDDKKNKMFILLTVKMPVCELALNKKNILTCSLGVDVPIEGCFEGKVYEIGNKEEFEYKRRQIQEGRKRLVLAIKNNHGGKGRKRKLQPLERYDKAEVNFTKTKIHEYSKSIIDLACKLNCASINLTLKKIEEVDSVEPCFILNNWRWNDLHEKIKYKAERLGIIVSLDENKQ